jgi:ubiquinone/menaquinone biosynthesis C-methylase UbiE
MSPVFPDHFSDVAARYADFRPRYPAALFDFLATLVPHNSLVWDCAAGSGQATLDLAARFERVIATDASQQQIASAKPLPNIEYRVAAAEQSGLPDRSFALVTVAQALHWFNLPRFYAEAKRVLKPNGLFAIWAYGINEVQHDPINRIVQDFYSNIVGPYWPPERHLVEAGYRTIPFPFEELVSPTFRMETHWTAQELLGYFSTWSATNRFIKATGHNPLQTLAETLATVWPENDSRLKIAWPLSFRLGRCGAAE